MEPAKTLITELQQENSDTEIEEQFSEDEVADDNTDKNQYFHVVDAEPPQNYDDPYSTLPPKVTLRLDAIKVTTRGNLLERHYLLSQVQRAAPRGHEGV